MPYGEPGTISGRIVATGAGRPNREGIGIVVVVIAGIELSTIGPPFCGPLDRGTSYEALWTNCPAVACWGISWVNSACCNSGVTALPERMCRVCLPTTMGPIAGMNRTIRLISF